jgi:hypothetical protein
MYPEHPVRWNKKPQDGHLQADVAIDLNRTERWFCEPVKGYAVGWQMTVAVTYCSESSPSRA